MGTSRKSFLVGGPVLMSIVFFAVVTLTGPVVPPTAVYADFEFSVLPVGVRDRFCEHRRRPREHPHLPVSCGCLADGIKVAFRGSPVHRRLWGCGPRVFLSPAPPLPFGRPSCGQFSFYSESEEGGVFGFHILVRRCVIPCGLWAVCSRRRRNKRSSVVSKNCSERSPLASSVRKGGLLRYPSTLWGRLVLRRRLASKPSIMLLNL
ncbi:uncharacterized protein EV422DRAFT_130411 [Fimicolochytrium jonesii]|uniref:uncharacterized protein n=1 Tax=Fimicolochytrium jonesii TaxID=1396493 RepID=UPI0022FE7336|nr:uncharacterized protein EV422DRAFT_130411 [Fimicolochytrium jonesii]KAI8819025.1 hypothetical protein EV422DRAFT_130411 [Fimicolochytrium jonesii]